MGAHERNVGDLKDRSLPIRPKLAIRRDRDNRLLFPARDQGDAPIFYVNIMI